MTNWKELIEKIKAGEATSYEQALFEEKRQEYEFFQEYLLEEEWDSLEKMPLKEDSPTISYGKMKRETNRRLVKKILWVVLVLAGIGGIGFYVTQQLMDRYYYNPTVTMEGSHIPDLATYEMLYNELMFPDYEMVEAGVERIGTATYRANYQYNYVYQDNWQSLNYSYEIIRNGREYPAGEMNPLLSGYSDRPVLWSGNDYLIENNQTMVMDKVKKMPRSSSIYGFLAFKESMTPQQVINWMGDPLLSRPGIELTWLSVKNEEAVDETDGGMPLFMGMNLNYSPQLQYENSAYNLLNFTYPELFPHGFSGSIRQMPNGSTYEEHYESLLKYLIDKKEQMDYVSYGTPINDLEKSLAYIQENGVKINGVYATANVDKFIQYAEREEVLAVEVLDTSLYSQSY